MTPRTRREQTLAALIERVFPTEQCDFHPPNHYVPMYGPHNYPAHSVRDVCSPPNTHGPLHL